jgi:serine/threonine protein phosphatase 1
MRRFVIGDIHGAYKALKQVLELSNFDYDNDLLICLGDTCDGWPETNQAYEELLKIKNLVYILGNHETFLISWVKYGSKLSLIGEWESLGGIATIDSYPDGIPQSHIDLIKNSRWYYELDNMLFVHAGFNEKKKISQHKMNELVWDRSLIQNAFYLHKEDKHPSYGQYDKIFIGHTPTIYFDDSWDKPVKFGNIFLIDTGAAYTGKVSLVDIDSGIVTQSDIVRTLYPGHLGRNYT